LTPIIASPDASVTTPVTDAVSTPVETFARTPLNVTKSVRNTSVQVGDLVPYTITVTNTEDFPRIDLDIVDLAPHGFRFIEETSLLNGVAIEPEVNGKELILNDIDFAANETKTWTLVLAVGAGVNDGLHTNNAFVRDALDSEISERAQAVVDHLIGLGLNSTRFTAIGYGPSQPIADNSTADGRAENRRIEFKLQTEQNSTNLGETE